MAAPLTLPLLVLVGRSTPSRTVRALAAAIGGLTAAEAAWALVYVAVGESQPWIWAVPVVAGILTVALVLPAPRAAPDHVTPTARSWPGLVAAAIALAVAGLTVAILVAEGEGDPLWAPVAIGAAAVTAGIGSVVHRRGVRLALLCSAASVLFGVGVLAIFSIGLLLVVAAAFAVAAAVTTASADGELGADS